MNTRLTVLGALLTSLFAPSSVLPALAARAPDAPVPAGVTRVLQGAQPNSRGGGPAEEPRDFMTDEQREEAREPPERPLSVVEGSGAAHAEPSSVGVPLTASSAGSRYGGGDTRVHDALPITARLSTGPCDP